MIWIILLILFIIGVYIWNNKLIIRFDTFFRKGFSLHYDECGVWVFCR